MKPKVTIQLQTSMLAGVLLGAADPWIAQAQTTFTKITDGAMVNDLGTFTRPVWADFDNDGFLDLFLSGFWDQHNVFYLNNRKAGFSVP